MKPAWEFEPPAHFDPETPIHIRVAAHVLRFALVVLTAGGAVRGRFEPIQIAFWWLVAWGLSRRLRMAYWTFVVLTGLGGGVVALLLLNWCVSQEGPLPLLRKLDVGGALIALGFVAWLVAFALVLVPGSHRRFTGRLRVVHDDRAPEPAGTETMAP